jgi:hypothetical protein
MRHVLARQSQATCGGRRLITALGKILRGMTYLAFRGLASSLHPVTTLNNIGLQADRARPPMEFQEEATCIAEDGAQLVSAPQGGGRGAAILAHGLQLRAFLVSKRGSHLGKHERQFRVRGGGEK